jgi:hypothetical protein
MMEHKTSATAPGSLLEGRFTGRSEFTDLVRQAFVAAFEQGWREIILCDANFEDWPLGDRAVVQSLNNWSKTGRKMTILAKSYTDLQRRHARFVSWRQTWAHLIECRVSTATAADNMPSALWSPGWFFERLDLQHCTGLAGFEVARRIALRERLKEQLLRSSPGFAASTLGL